MQKSFIIYCSWFIENFKIFVKVHCGLDGSKSKMFLKIQPYNTGSHFEIIFQTISQKCPYTSRKENLELLFKKNLKKSRSLALEVISKKYTIMSLEVLKKPSSKISTIITLGFFHTKILKLFKFLIC